MLTFNQEFSNRKEISKLIGGDIRKGITKSSKTDTILLFVNQEGLYIDYFYPKDKYDYCMFTGIGTKGHQDSIGDNIMYSLNIDVLTHKANKRKLVVFEKRNHKYYFVGRYELLETHQNIQIDKENNPRRVFVFHLRQVSDFCNYIKY